MEIPFQVCKVDQEFQENMGYLEYLVTWEKKEILGPKDKMDCLVSKERLGTLVEEGW